MGFYESFVDWAVSEPTSYGGASGVLTNQLPLEYLSTQFVEDPDGVERVFDQVETAATSDPYFALAQCSLLAGVVSTAAGKAQRLTKRLGDAISRLQSIVAGIVATVKATSFTITVGFPINVSIGVTW